LIRVALHSQDQKLQPLLAPALGKDFYVVVEPDSNRLKRLIWHGLLDVLLLDLDSEFCDAASQARFFEEICDSSTAVVALTDDASRLIAADLVQRGAQSYCRKPPALRELKAIIRRAYEYTVMKRELRGRHGGALPSEAAQPEAPEPLHCDGLIGSSPQMCAVYDLIRRVAPLNNSVLITGESGTGKELIARAIHNLGDRAQAPFVAVSCGAIPETLIESELFGHEKGAFTGSNGTRIGYFEQAAHGTLFLDEIGELSQQVQVKLLRVLQQREFVRLGSSRPIPLKARIIFATHRDLSKMVEENKFRLDLYYRINVMNIKAPCLADHLEDLPRLAVFFIKKYSEMYNKWVSGIRPEALALLEGYDWPGNVRELENVIQSAIICADGEIIQAKDLPESIQHHEDLPDEEAALPISSLERMIRDFKVRIVMKAIKDANGNKALAARRLNISRAYLHRLIRLEDNFKEVEIA